MKTKETIIEPEPVIPPLIKHFMDEARQMFPGKTEEQYYEWAVMTYYQRKNNPYGTGEDDD